VTKDIANKLNGKEKDNAEAGLKRKSTLVGPQRIPLGPSSIRPRSSVTRPQRVSLLPAQRTSRSISQEPAATLIIPVDEEDEENDNGMEVEEPEEFDEPEAEASLLVGEQEVEAMVGLESEADEETEETAKVATASKPPRIWPEVSTDRAARYRREVDAMREVFEDEVDVYDTTMVSEYAEDIFDYMGELEVGCFFFGFCLYWLKMTTDNMVAIYDALRRLHVRPKRDHMGDASNARRLAPPSAPALPHAPRNALDCRQHR